MKPLGDTLGALAIQFAILSLIAFGGINPVVPEIHRQAVEVHRWMSDKDFAALFALSQAAPGPNFLISTLVGWKAAGLPGALVAALALCAPSSVIAFWAAKVWDRHAEAPWRVILAAGLAPLTVGLIGSSAWLVLRAADRDWRLAAVTAVTAAVAYFTKLNPLACLAAAAGLGLAGVFS